MNVNSIRIIRIGFFSAVFATAMMGCGGSGGGSKQSGGAAQPVSSAAEVASSNFFNVKQATIVYRHVVGNQQITVVFDDYGAKMRIEGGYAMYIFDEKAGTAFECNVLSKTYKPTTIAACHVERRLFKMAVTDRDAELGGLTVSKETIAGKECSVHTLARGATHTSTGGWNGIVFLTTMDGSDVMRAISFSETAAADFLKIPEGYTKE